MLTMHRNTAKKARQNRSEIGRAGETKGRPDAAGEMAVSLTASVPVAENNSTQWAKVSRA